MTEPRPPNESTQPCGLVGARRFRCWTLLALFLAPQIAAAADGGTSVAAGPTRDAVGPTRDAVEPTRDAVEPSGEVRSGKETGAAPGPALDRTEQAATEPVATASESASSQATPGPDPEAARRQRAQERRREARRKHRQWLRAEARRRARATDAKAPRLAGSVGPLVILPPRPPAPREEPPLPQIVDHRSALERQMLAQWGWRTDKDGQIRVPLPDYRAWERIRLWGVEHLTAFRYTKHHHAITAVFALEYRGPLSSQSCMAEFEREGLETLHRHKVTIAPIATVPRVWRGQPLLVHRTEGHTHFLFTRYDFSAAWAAYPAYPGGCLISSTVVLWDGQPEMAREVVDRWIAEGVEQLAPLTQEVPFRH